MRGWRLGVLGALVSVMAALGPAPGVRGAGATSPSALSSPAKGAVESSGVYNLRLTTDNAPDYTDIDSFVRSASDQWASPQDKCIAIWRWARRSRRQTSCAADEGRTIWDPILHYNSYGTMNCGIVSSLNVSSWLRLGYQARYIELGGHTVSEVSWDEGKTWHLFDSSMSIFCYNHEGVVASCEEIKGAAACALSGGKSEPGHYYFYHYAPQCATHPGPTGWRQASDNPVDYKRTLEEGTKSYLDGFSVSQWTQQARFGQRYILNLQPYASYTRYWEPLDDASRGGDTKANDPDYFRPMPGGSDPDDEHGLNDIRGNGVWVFAPDLAAKDCRLAFYDDAGVETGSAGSPHLHPTQAGEPAYVIFEVSAANVITSLRIDARGVRKTDADSLRLAVSRYGGVDWTTVWESAAPGEQTITLRLRDQVAGVTQCLLKVEMSGAKEKTDVGLDTLTVTTITQLNRRTLPALTLGTNHVRLAADEQVDTAVLWPPLHADTYKRTVFAEQNLHSDKEADGIYKATLGAGKDGEECFATWRVAVPTDITSVTYGVVATTRTGSHRLSLQNSWDGENFTEVYSQATGGFPFDRQVLQTIAGDQVPAGTRSAFLKCVFFAPSEAATYNMPGIQDLLIFVRHKPRAAGFQPVEVTYNWTEHHPEGDVTRSHTELVTRLPHEYVINVAGVRDPTMNWVRLNLEGFGPEGEKTTPGYSDGVDVGPGCEYPKVTYTWGKNLALGCPYTASRPSSPESRNPDADGRELTNGIIIPPTDYVTSGNYAPVVRDATAFWDGGDPLTVTVDLGSSQGIAAVRVSTHQPNEKYCHPKTVEVAVSPDGQSWQLMGTIHHDDLWKPPADYEPWEHDDDPSYADLPAGGRLAYSYPLVLEKPAAGRYVRFVFAPLEGRGLGISELQVFDSVTTTPWPGDVAWLPQ